MLKEVMESVWMARCWGGGLSIAAHLSAASIVNASLKKTLNCFLVLKMGSAIMQPCAWVTKKPSQWQKHPPHFEVSILGLPLIGIKKSDSIKCFSLV